MRPIPIALICALATALCAAPAHAALVYVKTGDEGPTTFVAEDDGSEPRELARGTQPQISPDGTMVALLRPTGSRTRLVLVPASGSGRERLLASSTSVESVTFSPDSKLVAAEIGGRRLMLFETDTGRLATLARGFIKGLSFSPDSTRLAFGLGVDGTATGAADVHKVSVRGGTPRRLTRDGRSLLPVWGSSRIAFVKQKGLDRSGRVPTYDIWSMTERGREVERMTRTKVPDGVSGLLPIEWSADGTRLIAQYVGAEVRVGFTVDPDTGRTRALRSKVAFDLAGDGSAVLTQSGGTDPDATHNVYSAPYEGGASKLLVRRASFPDWSR